MRCETPTFGDFLYRIVLGGFHFRYFRYAVRNIPAGKDLHALDMKLIDTYGITSCRMRRLRQRRAGNASMQYIRYRSTFILMATDGKHPMFERIRSFDVREAPLHIGNYAIGCVGSRISVRVDKSTWKKVKAYHLAQALRDSATVEEKLHSLPYYQFPGVKVQVKELQSAINTRRRQAGLVPVSTHLAYKEPQKFSRRSYQRIDSPTGQAQPLESK